MGSQAEVRESHEQFSDRRGCRGPLGLACRERSAENVGDPVGSCAPGSVPNDTERR
jgi:hypothetical protein